MNARHKLYIEIQFALQRKLSNVEQLLPDIKKAPRGELFCIRTYIVPQIHPNLGTLLTKRGFCDDAEVILPKGGDIK